MYICLFFFKQKTAYEMRISDWSSDVCSSDLLRHRAEPAALRGDATDRGGAHHRTRQCRRPALRPACLERRPGAQAGHRGRQELPERRRDRHPEPAGGDLPGNRGTAGQESPGNPHALLDGERGPDHHVQRFSLAGECRLGQPCANGSPGQRALSGLRPGAQATRSAGSRCRRRGRAGRAGKQDQEAFEAMNDKDQKQLGKTLWAIGAQRRRAMKAGDFLDYMLSLLVLRYLSGKYEEAAKKELGADYPDPDTIDNGGRTPLSVW